MFGSGGELQTSRQLEIGRCAFAVCVLGEKSGFHIALSSLTSLWSCCLRFRSLCLGLVGEP